MPAPKKSPKLLAGRLACLFRGHAWDTGRLLGSTLAACSRCDAIVAVPFVDVPVLAQDSPEVGKSSPLGDLAAGRDAVAFLRARRLDDRPNAVKLRRRLTARPGASIDALTALAEQLELLLAREAGVTPEALEGLFFNTLDTAALREGFQPGLQP